MIFKHFYQWYENTDTYADITAAICIYKYGVLVLKKSLLANIHVTKMKSK